MYSVKSYCFSKNREKNGCKHIEKENHRYGLRNFIIIGINNRCSCRNRRTSADG